MSSMPKIMATDARMTSRNPIARSRSYAQEQSWPSTQKRGGYDIIIIARHGTPALSRKIHLTAKQYREWWKRYDLSGLAEGQSAPQKLKRAMENADVIYCSSLLRAQESAIMARGYAPDVIDAEFIEAALPPPPLGPIKLRPKSWGTLSRIVWVFGLVDSEERVTLARRRAKRVATRLSEAASGERMVVLMAHGWFNRMIGTQLRRSGWKMTKNQGDLHWKYRRYERKVDGE